PFLVWHPVKYAELLAERMRRHGSSAWLINTGWTGGGPGAGSRMSIKHTRAIINAIHDGDLRYTDTATDPFFGLDVPTSCPHVPREVLIPRQAWADTASYDRTASRVASLFVENFAQFEAGADPEVKAAGPTVTG
ncbi:MAG: phosphoenolpyruvate carboxykinase (ATP), partial [Planctomycetota bacterium]